MGNMTNAVELLCGCLSVGISRGLHKVKLWVCPVGNITNAVELLWIINMYTMLNDMKTFNIKS